MPEEENSALVVEKPQSAFKFTFTQADIVDALIAEMLEPHQKIHAVKTAELQELYARRSALMSREKALIHEYIKPDDKQKQYDQLVAALACWPGNVGQFRVSVEGSVKTNQEETLECVLVSTKLIGVNSKSGAISVVLESNERLQLTDEIAAVHAEILVLEKQVEAKKVELKAANREIEVVRSKRKGILAQMTREAIASSPDMKAILSGLAKAVKEAEARTSVPVLGPVIELPQT